MSRLARLATSFSVALVLIQLADAQTSPAPGAQPAPAQTPPRVMRRSIVHHYPYPYPEYYHGDQSAGFRNPGGQGRFLEYYPPGNRFQESGDPVRVARFDQAYGNRAEQLQA